MIAMLFLVAVPLDAGCVLRQGTFARIEGDYRLELNRTAGGNAMRYNYKIAVVLVFAIMLISTGGLLLTTN